MDADEQRYENISKQVNLMLKAGVAGTTSEKMRDVICGDAREIVTLERVLFHLVDTGTVIPAHDPEDNVTYYLLSGE
jgi:hypothetical protein